VLKSLLIVSAYLLGSIPTGWVVTKIVKKRDIRKTGSGATGATNVLRELGAFWAILVAFCDVMKAFIPTKIAVKKWPNDHSLHVLVGSAATFGHTKPIFLKKSGGKAVSTSAGAFFALAGREKNLWKIFQFALGTFIGAIAGSRGIVALGSVLGVVFGGFYTIRMMIHRQISLWYGFGSLLAVGYIIYMHRDNMGRMARREEKPTKFW